MHDTTMQQKWNNLFNDETNATTLALYLLCIQLQLRKLPSFGNMPSDTLSPQHACRTTTENKECINSNDETATEMKQRQRQQWQRQHRPSIGPTMANT